MLVIRTTEEMDRYAGRREPAAVVAADSSRTDDGVHTHVYAAITVSWSLTSARRRFWIANMVPAVELGQEPQAPS